MLVLVFDPQAKLSLATLLSSRFAPCVHCSSALYEGMLQL